MLAGQQHDHSMLVQSGKTQQAKSTTEQRERKEIPGFYTRTQPAPEVRAAGTSLGKEIRGERWDGPSARQTSLLLGEGLGHTGQNSAPLVRAWELRSSAKAARESRALAFPSAERNTLTSQTTALSARWATGNSKPTRYGKKPKPDCLGFAGRCGQRGHLKSTSAESAGFIFFVFCTVISNCPHKKSQHRTPPTSDFILHVTDHCLLSGYVVDNLSTPLAAQDGQKLWL